MDEAETALEVLFSEVTGDAIGNPIDGVVCTRAWPLLWQADGVILKPDDITVFMIINIIMFIDIIL